MRDVKGDALRMLESGTPIAVVARWSGTTEAQIREWKEEGTRLPVLKMLHEGKTPSEIARALKVSTEEARRMIVAAWKKDKEDFAAESTRRAVWG